MNDSSETVPSSAWSGVARILLCGILLGLAYNALGLQSRRPWGLPWIAEDKLAALAASTAVSGSAAAEPAGGYVTQLSDPLAIPSAGVLPEIPAAGRPVQIELGAVRQYADSGAALIVDARDPDEFAAGHIRGAINLPYDTAVSDPALLESLDAGGRPIITYCGGGACEVSLSLAEELIFAGYDRVAVYVGGFPEWEQAGYPVDRQLEEGRP